jgi:3-hydroxyisobutyrate dehydrogenase
MEAVVMVAVGFIGLGHLGVHLAGSLARAGHRLTVHDLDRRSADGLCAAGALWADAVADVANGADVVFTCLPSPSAVRAVVEGDHGLLAVLPRGATWIDMSTNDRSEVVRLAARCAERGIGVLECPVTGGVHLAAAGEITVLVGGDESLFERHRSLLDAIGSPLIHLGAIGSAAVVKVITNMLAFVHLVAIGEGLMLAQRDGIDLALASEAILHSSGNSFVHETETQLILDGSYDIGFTIDLACKDLGFATRLGRELGVPLEVAGLVEQTFVRARAQYGGSTWSTQVVKLLEDALGRELRADWSPGSLG